MDAPIIGCPDVWKHLELVERVAGGMVTEGCTCTPRIQLEEDHSTVHITHKPLCKKIQRGNARWN